MVALRLRKNNMEEKLLKEKELKELLRTLSKMNGYISVVTMITGATTEATSLGIYIYDKFQDKQVCYHREAFHCYEQDPTACTLTVLRNFYASPRIAEKLSMIQSLDKLAAAS